MKVGVLFDGLSALGKTPDMLILEAVEAIETALRNRSHSVVRVPVSGDGRWVERIRREKLDLAFNLCEGIDGYPTYEPAVIAALELLDIPYTGSSSWTTAICLRKHVVNAVLDGAGLPVPRWAVYRPGDDIRSVGFPAICKPAAEDASIGIEQGSVVRSSRALVARVQAMHKEWNEVIVQRFVDGREVNVGILDGVVLPIAEIDFGGLPEGMWRIVSYRSKWDTGSIEDLGAMPKCPADLPPELSEEISQLALDAWKLIGGQGYGRVDMRIDRSGRPWILEVNANPDISPEAGLPRMARVAGKDYDTLIDQTLGDELSAVLTVDIHELSPSHRARVAEIVRATGLFRPAEVDVAVELFDIAFGRRASAASSGGASQSPATQSSSDYAFLGAFTAEGELAGFACFGPTPATDRTFDLYWIAIDPRMQGSGFGTVLLSEVERRLQGQSARMLVVETSSRSDYEGTRRFYLARGYMESGRVRNYYGPSDDRIIFTKRFQTAPSGHGAVAA
jgi:D-alanine-D-alanine ligase